MKVRENHIVTCTGMNFCTHDTSHVIFCTFVCISVRARLPDVYFRRGVPLSLFLFLYQSAIALDSGAFVICTIMSVFYFEKTKELGFHCL